MEVRSYSGIERNEHEHNNIKNLEIIMFNEKKKPDKNAYAMSPCI